MNPQIAISLSQAVQDFQSGNLDGAELILKRVLQVDSRCLPALHIMGLIKASQSNHKEAAEFLKKAVRLNPEDASLQYNLAKALSEAGEDVESLLHHKKATGLMSNNWEAFLNYGKSLSRLGRHKDALTIYDKALLIKPNHEGIFLNKGASLKELQLYEEALDCATKALAINPSLVEAWSNRGVALKALKRYDEALVAYDRAIEIKPDFTEAWLNRGVTCNLLKRYDEALAAYDRAIEIKPDYVEAWSNKGVTCNELKRYEEVLAAYDRAIEIKPDFAEAWYNKGVTCNELKHYDEALAAYDRAIEIKPDFAEAWLNRGVACNQLKRYDEALAAYDRAIEIKPDYVEAWSNKGVSFNELQRYDEALAAYDRAIEIKPDFEEAWLNRGITCNQLKLYDKALVSYEKAMQIKPDLNYVLGGLIHTKMLMANWDKLEANSHLLIKNIQSGKKQIAPFELLSLIDSPELHLRVAKIWSDDRNPVSFNLGKIQKEHHQKIRIGYFSADFGNHAVSFLMAELFELHDKNQFETIAFSFGNHPDSPMLNRIQGSFSQFIDVKDKNDYEIAKLSRELGIDIAVDLGGHTRGSRTGIFAYRAAPIQTSYIGYLGTMGAEYMDYLIADQTIIPLESVQHYSEKIVYLPSYQVNDSNRKMTDKFFSREELGLPKNAFVFCCFNNNYKILPSTFNMWMRILMAVEHSVLFLYAENEWAQSNLIKEAQARGVDSSRLIFGKGIPRDEYLARYCACDLFLDTLPYNAGTTASDALWTGLPVLTLIGQSFPSRVAASLLTAIGLPELIAHTPEEYEALAIEFATHVEKLKKVKERLGANRLTMPLYDTPLFTRHIEAAYTQMYGRYQADLLPDHIHIG